MWRIAQPDDDDAIVEMCLGLYTEDPEPTAPGAGNMRTTLAVLRQDPALGRAVVLDVEGQVSGYALLIGFWSNGAGGVVCEVDELFVIPEHRNQGYGSSLFAAIARGDLWPNAIAGIALGVTPGNAGARRLYERLGFAAIGTTMLRCLPQLMR